MARNGFIKTKDHYKPVFIDQFLLIALGNQGLSVWFDAYSVVSLLKQMFNKKLMKFTPQNCEKRKDKILNLLSPNGSNIFLFL